MMRRSKWPHWGLNGTKATVDPPAPACGPRGELMERQAVDWSRAAARYAAANVGGGSDDGPESSGGDGGSGPCPGIVVLERLAWPQDPLDSMLLPRPPRDEALGGHVRDVAAVASSPGPASPAGEAAAAAAGPPAASPGASETAVATPRRRLSQRLSLGRRWGGASPGGGTAPAYDPTTAGPSPFAGVPRDRVMLAVHS